MAKGQRSSGVAYMNIKKGVLVQKQDGEEKTYGWVEGYITGIEVREDTIQDKKYKKICVNIVDVPGSNCEVDQLQFKLDSGYARAFCSILPNVDFQKKVKFSPSYEEGENGKGKTGMFMAQDGKALKWHHTRSSANGMPDLEQVTVKGQLMWDNTNQLSFMENVVVANAVESIRKAGILAGSEVPGYSDIQATQTQDGGDPVDDLPF